MEEQEPEVVASLGPVVVTSDQRIVYVDLEREDDERLEALRANLASTKPPIRVLERLPPINKNRLLVEIDAPETLSIFVSWLMHTSAQNPVFKTMLRQFGGRLLLLGAHWIIPKATEFQPSVLPQALHTDVSGAGQVLAVAMSVDGSKLGTLIDGEGSSEVTGENKVKQAATSIFCYDSNTVHGGPGKKLDPPYPKYLTNRVFFLLTPAEMSPNALAIHRRDNGLRGPRESVFIEI